MVRKLSKYTDEELLSLLKGSRKESEQAFTEIYDRYALKVNAYCRTIIGNKEQAEDIFQETFIRFYQNVRVEHPKSTIIGYLIKIARNLCLNYKRDKKQTVSIDTIDYSIPADVSFEDKELNDLILFAIDLLDNETKEVITMRVFNDMSYNEIADTMNITPARARYLVFNGKQKIKQILDPYIKDIYKY